MAEGHLAPPCRSMTKLYNFKAITDWPGCTQRLHGGEPQFRKGYDSLQRRNLHCEYGWEESFFRCLHLCFLRRSTIDSNTLVRPNVTESYRWRMLRWTHRLANVLPG